MTGSTPARVAGSASDMNCEGRNDASAAWWIDRSAVRAASRRARDLLRAHVARRPDAGRHEQVLGLDRRALRAVLLQGAVATGACRARASARKLRQRRRCSTTGCCSRPDARPRYRRHARDRERHAARRQRRSCSPAGRSAAATCACRRRSAFELPPAGTMLNVQWHFFNSTSSRAGRRESSARVHGAGRHAPEHLASMTWLGTENLDDATRRDDRRRMTRLAARTTPARDDPHLGVLAAHAHARPSHERDRARMPTPAVTRPCSTRRSTSSHQSTTRRHRIVLQAGRRDHVDVHVRQHDRLSVVGFGSSTTQEMCYNFVFSYPAARARQRRHQPDRRDRTPAGCCGE